MQSRPDMKKVVLAIALVVVVIGVYIAGDLWSTRSSRYMDVPGGAFEITEAQVVKAEMDFQPPASATGVRLAVYGGKDIYFAGRLWVEPDRIADTLLAAGYEETDPKPFQVMTDLYPQLSWFVLPANEIQSAYKHPQNRGEVLVSTRRDEDGRAEVFFQQTTGKRTPLTWQYYE